MGLYLSVDELPSFVQWRQHRLSINMTLNRFRTQHSIPMTMGIRKFMRYASNILVRNMVT